MSQNISTTIKRIRGRNKGDYLIYLKRGLTWKYYQQTTASTRRGV